MSDKNMMANIYIPSWYKPRREDLTILKAFISQDRGMRAFILFGLSGVGKTALAHAVASALGERGSYLRNG
jgi:DNA helicase TIP49 (TBP-interacting protein)